MNFSFNPYPFFWSIILPGLLVVGIIMIWIEARGNRRRGPRILVSIIAMLSVVGLAIRPLMKKELAPRSYALLTDNYNEPDLDSLKDNNKEIEVIDLRKASKSIGHFVTGNSIKELYVLGDGLEPSGVDQLKGLPVRYLPGKKPQGIIDINYSTKVIKGRPLDLEISTRLDENGLLILNTPGAEADTLRIQKGLSRVKIHSTKNVIGNFLDQVSLFNMRDTLIDKGLIPYTVRKPAPVKVLFLMGYPNFESKFLKNWLGNNQHEVVIRSRVSREKFVTETMNSRKPQSSITSIDWLKSVDLVISDPNGWDDLSVTQRNLILKFVNEDGMGLLFLLSSANDVSDTRINNLISPGSIVKDTNGKAEFTLLESGVKFTLPRIELSNGSNAFSFPVTFDSKNSSTSIALFSGLGKIGFSLVGNTYSFILNGFQETYSSYWSDIIEVVSKSWNREFVEVSANSINRISAPMDIKINSSQENPQLRIDSTSIGLRQNPYFDNIWMARFWPERNGWHSIKIDNHLVDHFFVYPAAYWQSLERERMQVANSRDLGLNRKEAIVIHKNYQPIPWIYFFLTFTLCMGYLWLEPRL